MGASLYLYSKNKIIENYGPVDDFFTERGFYTKNPKDPYHNKISAYLGKGKCIDDDIAGYDLCAEINGNTYYTWHGECFDKKKKSFPIKLIESTLAKIHKVIEKYGLLDENWEQLYHSYGAEHPLFKHLEGDHCLPYLKNLLYCIIWVWHCDPDDKIYFVEI